MAKREHNERVLLIFSHPDDESYGCGGTMAKYVQEGNTDVFLLTLTRGEASSQGQKLGLTKEQMGEKRSAEIREVARIYGLTELFLLDFPDSQLETLDPCELEGAISKIVKQVEPQVIISFPPHGISGFVDHIITHAVVKRVFVELRETTRYLRRFAMQCVPDTVAGMMERHIHTELVDKIDCRIHVEPYLEFKRRGLEVQKSIAEVIARDNANNALMQPNEYYRFFKERFVPPVEDLFANLRARRRASNRGAGTSVRPWRIGST